MQASRLPVGVPAALGEGVGDGLHVEAGVAADLEHRQVGRDGDLQPVDLPDAGDQDVAGVPDDGRQAQVAVLAQGAQRRPGTGDRHGRAGARRRRGAVEPATPGAVVEPPLRGVVVLLPEQQDARALEGVAVLVDVGADAGDAGDPEVPGGDRLADPLPERQQQAAQARVDVAQHTALGGERRDVRHRVDHAVGVVRGAGHDHRGAVVEGRRQLLDQQPLVLSDPDPHLPDAQQVAGLGERRVGRHGRDDARGLIPLRAATSRAT